jgi:hypothetical protein
LLQGIKPRDRARTGRDPSPGRPLGSSRRSPPRNSRARSLNRPTGSIFGWAVGIMRLAGPFSGFYSRSNDRKTRGGGEPVPPVKP